MVVMWVDYKPIDDGYLTIIIIRPVAQKGYGSIAHEAKLIGLILTHGP